MSKVKFRIIDGGKAIPIGNNLYKVVGRSHEEGGVITELKDGNAKTIIEKIFNANLSKNFIFYSLSFLQLFLT